MKISNVIDKIGYGASAGLLVWVINGSDPAPHQFGDDGDTYAVGGSAFEEGNGNGGTGAGTGAPTSDVPYEGDGTFDSEHAINYAAGDSAGGGYCARGVANIAEAQGLGNFRGLNAHDFEGRMASQGWVRLEGATPETAPVGSMLLFNSDTRLGQPNRGTGGGSYGHVELVGQTSSGGRTYISDAARSNYGGTVPDNFTGVWVRQ